MKGYVEGNKYITYRNKDHYFKIFQGYGISESILDDLPSNVTTIQFDYHGVTVHEKLEVSRNKVKEIGHVFNDGDDKQYVVPEKEMEKTVINPDGTVQKPARQTQLLL